MVTGHRLGSAAGAATGCEVDAGVGVACGCREQPTTTTASAAASATVRVPVRAAMCCSSTQPTSTVTATRQGRRWFPWPCFGGYSRTTLGSQLSPGPEQLQNSQPKQFSKSGYLHSSTPQTPGYSYQL